jgi:glutathione-regulated potassium-efflux system ancillary protein KefC
VIIAGFGRYGQIAGRVLLSSGVKMVILDHDPTMSIPAQI